MPSLLGKLGNNEPQNWSLSKMEGLMKRQVYESAIELYKGGNHKVLLVLVEKRKTKSIKETSSDKITPYH